MPYENVIECNKLYQNAEASEEEDEDSAEEIFSRPSTSRGGVGSIVIERATESDNISTDFGSILQSATSNK